MAKADVSVLFTGSEQELDYENVEDVTFINGESHGKGPAGAITPMTRRLILHSNRVDSVLIEGK
jgi:hypothetical protein